jgi:molybdopterin/thiamine biosynthesis adenylyltransferase
MSSRNILSWGRENQILLDDTRVLVVGSDLLAQYVLSGLAGLNIGEIYFMDNSTISSSDKSFLYNSKSINRKERVKEIEKTLMQINANIKYRAIFSRFAKAFAEQYNPEVIIDTTNDLLSKKITYEYATSKTIPLISASSDLSRASVFLLNQSDRRSLDKILLREFNGKSQGSFSSGIAAGIVCEELRKIRFRHTDDGRDSSLEDRLDYNLFSDDRRKLITNRNTPSYFKSKKALVVGAGGIGNFVALNLALLGIGKIDIIDYDLVEHHNLNRQILLYGMQGQKKSKVLAERVREIDPEIDANGIYCMIGRIKLHRDKYWLEELYQREYNNWRRKPANFRETTFPTFKGFIEKYYGNTQEFIPEEILVKQKYDIIFDRSYNLCLHLDKG